MIFLRHLLCRDLQAAMGVMLTSFEEQTEHSTAGLENALELPSLSNVSNSSKVLSLLACKGATDAEIQASSDLGNGQTNGQAFLTDHNRAELMETLLLELHGAVAIDVGQGCKGDQ